MGKSSQHSRSVDADGRGHDRVLPFADLTPAPETSKKSVSKRSKNLLAEKGEFGTGSAAENAQMKTPLDLDTLTHTAMRSI